MKPSSNGEMTIWRTGDASGPRYAVQTYGGESCDLDIDFGRAQPHVVTELLSNCLLLNDKPLPAHEAWSWTLKKRLQALLAITTATRGSELVLSVHCSNRQCRERIELPLDLTRFQQNMAEEVFVCNIGDRAFTMRLPNGRDQDHWLQQQDESFAAIAKKLVLRIDAEKPGDDWTFPEAWLAHAGEALEQHDELMTLKLNAKCPVCALDLAFAIDLEAELLTCLSQAQKKLLLDVHQLALAYHWTEKEILALSPKRRNFYLNQLQNQSEGQVSK